MIATNGTVLGIWAPLADRVDVVVGSVHRRLEPATDGWFRDDQVTPPGSRYEFSLDGGAPMPDPRSQRQPEGVFGPSEVVDHQAFTWRDAGWRGFHLPSAVLYELHIGTFTAAGTFDAALERLDHLVDLGIDAIEIMPVASFDGNYGWGYDGVALSAPHERYGGPGGLKALVDAAHRHGLGVLLDVVWNHFGPTGSRCAEAGPYLREATTPWGAALNLDGPGSDEVRRYLLDSARGWYEHFHVDGLRLDAVHALVDTSPRHLLAEAAAEAEVCAAHLRRPLWLIAESDANDPRTTNPLAAGGLGMDAQWADDLHHAVHVTLSGERDGYLADYRGAPDVVAAYERGFIYDGRWSPARGRTVGGSTATLARSHLVTCAQNHDQIGNRVRGDRLCHLVGARRAMIAAALVLLGPGVPMLFMGEEWAASTPFPFFAGPRDPEIDAAVTTGRIEEFSAFGWDPAQIPDPIDPATMTAATLRWHERREPEHESMLRWHRSLIALRRAERDLTDPTPGASTGSVCDDILRLRRGSVEIVVNLGPHVASVGIGVARRLALASSESAAIDGSKLVLPPVSVAVTTALR